MGRGRSGREMLAVSRLDSSRVEASATAARTVPDWREAFGNGTDYQSSGDVDHDRRTVTERLQRQWDDFARDYQDGVSRADIRNIMKEFDWRTGAVYGYVRTTNSFKINEALYDPANAGKTDAEIFTRTDRSGALRDLQTVRTLDRLIGNHTTRENATYTRFASPNAIKSLYGLNDSQIAALSNARSLNASQLRMLNRAFAGKTSYSPAYTSTSANRSMNAFGSARAMRERNLTFERRLYVPKGTQAYAVRTNAQESEVMFGRHANTSLMQITVSDDGHVVFHEMFEGYRRR